MIEPLPQPRIATLARWMTGLALGAALVAQVARGAPMDTSAAENLLAENKCTKCHDIVRKKDGPAYRDVAAKFRGEPDAVPKIVHHMTAGDRVKFPDGHEEKHKKIKADPAEAQALAQWLLTLEGGKKY